MIEKLLKTKYVLLLFSLYVISNNYVSAQTFERVENIVGLGILEENNGVAVADYDGDNDLDIFVVAKAKDNTGSPKTLSRLFRNNNDGSFTDVTEFAGFQDLLTQEEGGNPYLGLDGHKNGAFWGDYNNDGFPDLLLTYSLKVQLWRNLGNGTFANITSISGLDTVNSCLNTGATWFDYDNDGLLDIYINDWAGCGSNRLFKNNGNNTFTDVTVTTGIQQASNYGSYTALPFDFNEDGYIDLYVTNNAQDSNSLYINNNGTSFSDQAQLYGLDTAGEDKGISISDYNNDGFFDFFVSDENNNFFLENNGDNTFADSANDLGIGNSQSSWGTLFSDFDLDGDEDLLVLNGNFYGSSSQTNYYYKNLTIEGQEIFEDNSLTSILGETAISVTAVDFDYDNDGDKDVIVTNSDGSIFFYENKLLNFDDAVTSKNWFKIKLEGTTSNRDAIGTIITLTTSNGTLKRYYPGVGFLSQNLNGVHFGLDNASQILSLEIKWPSGLIETFNNLDVNATIKATEGSGYEILNIIPSQKIYGCTDPISCNYNPDATLDDGSCSYIDSQTIVGNVSSSFLSTETYSYAIGTESTASWQVTGGEIMSGQDTGQITVKWAIEEMGHISVTESNDTCSSLPVSIDVSLGADNLPTNVSVARLWNEALLESIRGDFARPTVHARNLFHSSVAMYDIWAIYDDVASPYLMGNSVHGFSSALADFIPSESVVASQEKAISYAMYRLLSYRFQNAPQAASLQVLYDLLMDELGYDINDTSLLYDSGNAAALGNYVAQTIIDYGLQDGSRESTGYDNDYYAPINTPLALDVNDNTPMTDPNRWQPLAFEVFIDQSGNVIDGNIPGFLSPEWGNVLPFALTDEDKVTYERDGDFYNVYHDPSSPPRISLIDNNDSSDAYKWGFSMVSIWQSHLDPTDGVMWDISPNSFGNVDISNFPTTYLDFPSFYNFFDGGAMSNGHTVNPITGNPYEVNMVPRGDYGRVLAEFWADGPHSETPPGHWFTILNYVNDHPQFERRFQGEGDELDPLEWDVKAYFILGGGMHDSAISAWSVKGWYDYIRPISAIRSMALRGQSTDNTLSNYHVGGIELIENYIEVVEAGDPLAGFANQHVGKIKLYTWKGHDYIGNTETDMAGVGWILAENWFPYQRPTFVTPPFAGYVSGHSTYSRAASELMTMMTGSEYFPGGLGEFVARKNEFLVFEEGPSVDVVLQWATYKDASDQTSLSRIWGGIHPPADDIPGRFIGHEVATEVFDFAVPYFEGSLSIEDFEVSNHKIYPNPTQDKEVYVTNTNISDVISVFDLRGRQINVSTSFDSVNNTTRIKFSSSQSGIYLLRVNSYSEMIVVKN
ncbi:FG-GAP-like repeat-containing protein [Winogradskyella sp. SYSU M77433]|uniref:FG-GAP-like repeat-containing protein n=1 Tax=Winogradskyella sp. SYSU M77433 TaxID=3042722 RepID=UPI0024808160|nr:FG-GAP-like repeat-containing protein [Winogradskyella sp. SYSU M77433]MDH7914592.1 FG-GAP-like repeat-containing protein [Winogradskyella sp. SYSU M77433]